MGHTKHTTPAATRPAIWGELSKVCERVHAHLYESGNRAAARKYSSRLRQITEELPENDVAIVRAEALALLCELTDDLPAAIEHRTREIELIERLHESVRESVEAGKYDKRTATSILADWDQRALKKRRAILRGLKAQLNSTPVPAIRRSTR